MFFYYAFTETVTKVADRIKDCELLICTSDPITSLSCLYPAPNQSWLYDLWFGFW